MYFTIKTESSQYHKLSHVRNIRTFIQLHSKPLTLCNLYSYFILQTFSNAFYGSSNSVCWQCCLQFSLLLYCCVLFQPFLPWQEEQALSQWYVDFCLLLWSKKPQRKLLNIYHEVQWHFERYWIGYHMAWDIVEKTRGLLWMISF